MRSILGCLSGLTVALALHVSAFGQENPPASAQSTATTGLPSGTIVELEITQHLGSALSKKGDRFGLRLWTSVKKDDQVVLPEGLDGEGEVIHAERSRGGGKPGELLLAARFLIKDGAKLPLKGLKMGSSGANNTTTALALAFVTGPFAMLVQGGEVVVPAGSLVHAKLATDYPIAQAAPTAPN